MPHEDKNTCLIKFEFVHFLWFDSDSNIWCISFIEEVFLFLHSFFFLHSLFVWNNGLKNMYNVKLESFQKKVVYAWPIKELNN